MIQIKPGGRPGALKQILCNMLQFIGAEPPRDAIFALLPPESRNRLLKQLGKMIRKGVAVQWTRAERPRVRWPDVL